jgi:methyl-accepting chemotaxis protein
MSRLFGIIVNLRIGTKLAITSGIGIALICAIIASQLYSNTHVKAASELALRRQTIAFNIAETRASLRGMQLGVRDLRLARNADDVKKAAEYLVDRQKNGLKWLDTALALVAVPEQQARLNQVKSLMDQYAAGTKEIEAVKAQIFTAQKQENSEAAVAALELKVISIARDKTLPMALQMEEVANQVRDQALTRAQESATEAASEMASAERVAMMIGGAAALIMLGAVVFSIFTISRPMKALTGGMLELAGGNFDVVLPGLGRKDEIGDVAQAVETFKVKSAEKARAEAQANADRELKEAAEKAERDRVAAEEKMEADKRAAAERDAATAKVMADFDAAVGGIAKAAMAGDFAQRVPLEGKEGVIRNLAEAMNNMCDNIGRVMDDLVIMMSALAEGDLTKRINADYQGTFGTLKESANATAIKLSETVSEITASAKEVANAAAEISTSTTDLSQRTEEQAAGLEETSASMEEISATVKKNAENAQQANTLTAGAREVADKGGAVVANTVEAMSRIEDSSNKIADIIGVIDEIARQTNLLALNAAVEAARAGDAGRGFAVVASEVRSLAQRSSQAAKDIKDLITNSSTQVKDGVDLVNRTGTSLGEIVESIKKVADIVADIANASSEQATGIDQVNKALTQMDEVTQQNSALVEENAATAKTLESQSAAMSERVSFFRIDQAAQRIVSTPARPAARPSAARPAPAVKRGSPVGRMQSNLATALKHEEFEEF